MLELERRTPKYIVKKKCKKVKADKRTKKSKKTAKKRKRDWQGTRYNRDNKVVKDEDIRTFKNEQKELKLSDNESKKRKNIDKKCVKKIEAERKKKRIKSCKEINNRQQYKLL